MGAKAMMNEFELEFLVTYSLHIKRAMNSLVFCINAHVLSLVAFLVTVVLTTITKDLKL